MTLQEAVRLLEEMLRRGWKLGYGSKFSLSYTRTAYWVEPFAVGDNIWQLMDNVDAAETDWEVYMK